MLKAGGASQGVQECRGVVPPIVGRTEEWSPVDAPIACIVFVSVCLYSCVREVWSDDHGYGSVLDGSCVVCTCTCTYACACACAVRVSAHI